MPNWHPWARAVEKELDRQAAEAYEAGKASVEDGQPPLDVGRMRSELMELRRALTLEKQRGEGLRRALQYIQRPTMGLPALRDPEEFVDEASESNVRLALKTCIRQAREALRISQGDSK